LELKTKEIKQAKKVKMNINTLENPQFRLAINRVNYPITFINTYIFAA